MPTMLVFTFVTLSLAPCIPQESSSDVQKAIENLGDKDPEVRNRAANFLIQSGEPALGPLRKVLEGADDEVGAQAKRIIEKIQWPHFQRLLSFQDPELRDHIVRRRLFELGVAPLDPGEGRSSGWTLSEVKVKELNLPWLDSLRVVGVQGRVEKDGRSSPLLHQYALEALSKVLVDLTCMSAEERVTWLSEALRKSGVPVQTEAQAENIVALALAIRATGASGPQVHCSVEKCKHTQREGNLWKLFRWEASCQGGYRSRFWILETSGKGTLQSLRCNPGDQTFPHDPK